MEPGHHCVQLPHKKNTHNRSSVCTHTKQTHAAHTAPDIDAYVMTVEMIV